MRVFRVVDAIIPGSRCGDCGKPVFSNGKAIFIDRWTGEPICDRCVTGKPEGANVGTEVFILIGIFAVLFGVRGAGRRGIERETRYASR